MDRLIDFTDSQLANTLHFLEGHEEDLDTPDLLAWKHVKEMILVNARIHVDLSII